MSRYTTANHRTPWSAWTTDGLRQRLEQAVSDGHWFAVADIAKELDRRHRYDTVRTPALEPSQYVRRLTPYGNDRTWHRLMAIQRHEGAVWKLTLSGRPGVEYVDGRIAWEVRP